MLGGLVPVSLPFQLSPMLNLSQLGSGGSNTATSSSAATSSAAFSTLTQSECRTLNILDIRGALFVEQEVFCSAALLFDVVCRHHLFDHHIVCLNVINVWLYYILFIPHIYLFPSTASSLMSGCCIPSFLPSLFHFSRFCWHLFLPLPRCPVLFPQICIRVSSQGLRLLCLLTCSSLSQVKSDPSCTSTSAPISSPLPQPFTV